MKKKVITKLCMSPRTHATTKQGKEKKTMPYKWARQGKVQLATFISCEISGALHLAQLGLMAGWLTKHRWISKFSKLAVG